ncbi:MAG: S8 family serine peptidase [Candidatus Pacearchaeota archaeon]|jgi:subtilisin family serine protease
MKTRVIFIILVLFSLFFNLISADSSLSTQWKNNLDQKHQKILNENLEKCGSNILNKFAKVSKDDNSFVNVMIDFTNFSDIDSLISDFSEGELKNLLNRNYPYTITPSIAATVSEETFFRLLQDKRVDKIYPNGIVHYSLEDSASLIHASNVWNTGYTGEGVKVCIIDTGVDANHPDLSGRIADEKCYCSISEAILESNDKCCWDGNEGVFNETDVAIDLSGHGTHVAGIVASEDSTYRGISPNADLYIAKILNSSGAGTEYDIRAGISWCVNQSVDIISMSFGQAVYSASACSGFAHGEINRAYGEGIFLVAASGNDFYHNGIDYPACEGNVTSVGATDKQDNMAKYNGDVYSNRGQSWT